MKTFLCSVGSVLIIIGVLLVLVHSMHMVHSGYWEPKLIYHVIEEIPAFDSGFHLAKWINSQPQSWVMLHGAVKGIADLPIYAVCLVLGAVVLIIGLTRGGEV